MTSRGPHQTTVVNIVEPCAQHFEITLRANNFDDALPGQFIQILCRDAHDSNVNPMLRRPFSIGGLTRHDNGVDLVIIGHVVGPGTKWLSQLRIGDVVDIIGPLGSAFMLPRTGVTSLLVAGGIGLPPIRWFAERLAHEQRKACAIFGARTANRIPMQVITAPNSTAAFNPCLAPFAALGVESIVATEDGSIGMKGLVTDAMREVIAINPETELAVYACGPNPMLAAISLMCAEHDIPNQLALERVMGCGMGTCQSCVVPIHDSSAVEGWRYALCCSEGPVFEGDAVIWQQP